MKKFGAIATLFLLLMILVPLTLANIGDNCTSNSNCSSGEICKNNLCSAEEDVPISKTEKGFECLEEKAGDCSGLTVQELALTILATPDNVFDDCVAELEDKQTSNHWGNIRDTALAILAMKHAGENTDEAEEWLIKQNKTPNGLTWYIQEDSDGETECNIAYGMDDYTFIVGEDKKIDDSSLGSCLSKAQSDFWLEISSTCYDKEFTMTCDKQFIGNLLYKNRNSRTIYVLEGTKSAQANSPIKLSVKSKCFGESSSCDYEATVWATLALAQTDHEIEDYIPYIIAMSDSNERYLPEAFIYILTNYDDYASQLISNQKLGNYWEAPSTAYNRFYDTALALISLGSSSSSEQIVNAKNWLLDKQGTNGCWNNQIRDTAIVLWALEGKPGRIPNPSPNDPTPPVNTATTCAEGNFFCIPELECPTAEVRNNYFCSSPSHVCCETENLKTCTELGGKTCLSTELCSGNERKASDVEKCCTGTCELRSQETECETNYYTCYDSCSDSQEELDFACDDSQVCCKTRTNPLNPNQKSSLWWIWVLLVLILVVLVAILYLYRENLKLLWFQIKSKFRKDKDGGQSPRGPPGFPPRPGFPPIRRGRPPIPQQGQSPQLQSRSYDRRDKEMSDTFQKLREMSG